MEFIASQFKRLPLPSTSFAGQTVIVTGANVGLGLEAARHFAGLNAAKVILACRSISKGEEAARSIAKSTGREGVCEVWQVDIGNFGSVKEFVKRVEKLDRLDVVCENAGIATNTYREMSGFESTIAVNVVGTFLMALNLLPILRRSGAKYGTTPKLVITSSEVHAWAKFAEKDAVGPLFQTLNENNEAYLKDRYMTSKLLEVFFVRELASHMSSGLHSSEPVVLNCLNPGLCHSGLVREAKGVQAMIYYIFKLILARTAEVGSRTIVAGATAGTESHGQYMTDCHVEPPSSFVRSQRGGKIQKQIWEELIAILEKEQPGISKNI